MSADPVIIASYARTPIGAFGGELARLKATELGAAAIQAAVERAGLDPAVVDQVIIGCVLAAGLGQAPARQAALGAGLPVSAQAVTVNKMCGSGMQAAILAHDSLAAGSADLIIAGGMESMSNAPFAVSRRRAGARIGHEVLIDTMMYDGLEDAYVPGKAMGAFAEDAVREYQLTREEQDAYALRSLSRATAAIANGAFENEIVPVQVAVDGPTETTVIRLDEQPGKAKPEKIPTLKPAFLRGGTITAANASSISDGAAALVMTRESIARRLGLPILARVASHAAYAHEPGLFSTAPGPAMRKALQRAGWSVDDVDLFEVNEAFAVVAMIAARELAIPADRLNVNGGATALGHPIGASGARILATLIAALQVRGLKRGLASLCIGGGEAIAMAIELA